ncbi:MULTISPECIES: LysR family transcriptional regulator [unclassified Sphingomonas]|uniref:LysR family transcriptional regulator n=1 Tax=unclassified Sphingomonas TaxID=196159 RepID=UPI0006F80C76|nr:MULTISPECIES: LysR family transcriptional regulator [unclassified Sphingomonas]KQM61593.1 LysR family transcriptional regulator [Sphingomonas sp. Leaf16]KQN12689.1 LysR family transcriptional regulator [Sphingomonas sp. Leaf29]KQN19170.1 LysR family transcriptional regulator [Sphingomonas sp. Leaf32]
MKPFDLNLRHLRAISHIVAARSLNRAAAAAGLSQPALTQGLGKLERQLGTRLFERNPDGMTATAAGLALAERTDRAFALLAGVGRRSGKRGFARPDALMTSTQAEAFLHFADAGGFAGAAANSGLSQPAIHRAVRELEAIWATPLAERRGRGMVLTAAGRAVARSVRLAANEIAAGIVEAHGDAGEGGRVAIGAMPLSRALLLPHALARFLTDARGTVIDVVEGSWRELVEPLLDGVIDLMIGALRSDPPAGIDQMPLFSDRLVIFGRAGHPLAGKAVDLDQLAAQPWVVGPNGTPLRSHWEALFAGRPLPPVPVECGSVMVIRGLLAESDLLTLLSPDQVALEMDAGLLVRIGPDLEDTVRTIGITTRTGWRPTAGQARLIGLLQDASRKTRLQENR